MSSEPQTHPVLSAWAGDPETDAALAWPAELSAMLRFESELAQAEAGAGIITEAAAARIADICAGFAPDMDNLRAAAARDGLVVPGLIAQLRTAVGRPHSEALHFGATSQDVVDSAFMLRLAPLMGLYAERLKALTAKLEELVARWGAAPLMGVTRMRDALPGTVADRVAIWRGGLDSAAAALADLRRGTLAVQFAGPVGRLDRLEGKGHAVRAALADALDLADPGASWQVDRARIMRIGAALAQVTAALGKIGLDLGLMAQDRLDDAVLSGGGSSAMPHKVNPVDAELLVALARHAAAAQGGLGQAILHENERSGAGWTLEWLTLPPIVRAVGSALTVAPRLLDSIERLGGPSRD